MSASSSRRWGGTSAFGGLPPEATNASGFRFFGVIRGSLVPAPRGDGGEGCVTSHTEGRVLGSDARPLTIFPGTYEPWIPSRGAVKRKKRDQCKKFKDSSMTYATSLP